MLTYKVLGVMSGTSVDGLDIAMCGFSLINENWKLNIIKTKFVKYPDFFRRKLLGAHLLGSEELRNVDMEFALFTADNVNKFLADVNEKPDLIASHGHTIFHRPDLGFTYQMGNGEIIAKKTGIPVVYDFRSGDIALGGQGAPLVPIGDEILFGNYSACLNLGGFSNISFKDNNGFRIAYDICPVNIVLNKYSSELGYEFDNGGNTAASGVTDLYLFKELNNLNYYFKNHPKSLSREWVEAKFYPIVEKYKNTFENILNTLVIHIADQIAKNLNGIENVLVTGGGAFNNFLIENIKYKTNTKLIIPDDELVNFKEAVVFAFLGILRYLNRINCLASVTGASRDSCCGVLSVV